MKDYQSKEYRCWVRMIHRCHNPKYEGYETYGGRGIHVCQQWRDSYQAFLEDMGRAPTPEHSLDRENNDQGYSKENCRWATSITQANNRRDNVHLEFGGMKMTMAEWARALNFTSRKKLWKRLQLHKADPVKWPLDKVFTPDPPKKETP